MLRSYTGPRLELGMAEQFILLLSDIPDYTVLLEGQLIRAEFDSTITQFKDSLTAMISTANLVLNHPDLKRLLHLILGIGNFLNYVSILVVDKTLIITTTDNTLNFLFSEKKIHMYHFLFLKKNIYIWNFFFRLICFDFA